LSPDTEQAIEWIRRYHEEAPSVRILVCLGNHDYYGKRTMAETESLWRALSVGLCDVLIDSSVVIDGIRFHGCTMWTNYVGDEEAMYAMMTDFARIPDASIPLLRGLHLRSRDLLSLCVGTSSEPVVVVTHHLPSYCCIHPQYSGSALNGAFASTDLDEIIDLVCVWLHGHTHKSIDEIVTGTRMICNPRGYIGYSGCENPAFDAERIIQL
jgi:predicted phosphohydrolase